MTLDRQAIRKGSHRERRGSAGWVVSTGGQCWQSISNMSDSKPRPPGQTLLELHVADVDLDAFASLFQRLAAAGITFTTLRERQSADPQWLEQFTFLDNQTRLTSGNPEVPRSVAAMRSRLTQLALDPAA